MEKMVALPITQLKIDIEFIRDLATNQANRDMVEAIGRLARAFNVCTVAEGIEVDETFECLQAAGIDFGQGFHLPRPARIGPLPGPATALSPAPTTDSGSTGSRSAARPDG